MTRKSPTRIAITGASSGIGAALAEHYACPGVDLFLTGRDGARLRSTALKCSAKGAQVHYICADVRDSDVLGQWLIEQDRKHPIDLVIAAAGISAGLGQGLEHDAQVKAIFDVNVTGVMNTIHPLLPRMAERRSGHIAILASIAGFVPWPGAPAYAASKAAIKAYGLALNLSLRRSGVDVSVICPGFVDTPMTQVNPYKMPWLMDVHDAATVIAKGLSRRKAMIAFPWQAAWGVGFLSILPFWVQRLALPDLPAKPALSDQANNSL